MRKFKMKYPTYLIHFNKLHSKKNGRFISGDGDGDGIANDHADRKKEHKSSPGENLKYVSPNNPFHKGYWMDVNTGKKAGFGAQLKGAPAEFKGKEFGKSMLNLGILTTVNTAAQVGKEYIKATSGKKSFFGKKKEPAEFNGKEFGKTMLKLGIITTTTVAAKVGQQFIQQVLS